MEKVSFYNFFRYLCRTKQFKIMKFKITLQVMDIMLMF